MYLKYFKVVQYPQDQLATAVDQDTKINQIPVPTMLSTSTKYLGTCLSIGTYTCKKKERKKYRYYFEVLQGHLHLYKKE